MSRPGDPLHQPAENVDASDHTFRIIPQLHYYLFSWDLRSSRSTPSDLPGSVGLWFALRVLLSYVRGFVRLF
jgi:hypothetical protein